MRASHRRSSLPLARVLALSLVVTSGAGAALGCGARSGVEGGQAVPTVSGTGGSEPVADPPNPALPARGGAPGREPVAVIVGGAPNIPDAPVVPTVPERPVKPPCEEATLTIDDLRPQVMLLVDQSRSMATPYPDKQSPNTRWSLVGKALFDPTDGVVKTFEGSLRFGVAFFTSHAGICPFLSEVQAETGNYLALSALYAQLMPDGNTPTGASIEQLVTELESTTSVAQQTIVLVTDGNPNTCANGSGASQMIAGQAQAIAATNRAYADGFDTYVLGISKDIAGKNLQELANAGKGQPLDAVYGVDPDAAQPYEASDSVAGLTAQFSDILSQIPFCEVRLQRDVAVSEAVAGKVLLDGQTLAYSPRNGFTLLDPRHLAIVGDACSAIKSGAKELSVRISCD